MSISSSEHMTRTGYGLAHDAGAAIRCGLTHARGGGDESERPPGQQQRSTRHHDGLPDGPGLEPGTPNAIIARGRHVRRVAVHGRQTHAVQAQAQSANPSNPAS
jgi:hypothetical protein